MNPIVVIPARLAAQRLPEKPLKKINERPMIEHVWRRATAAAIGPVVVACGDREIADVIEAAGGNIVMTPPDLPSGSDRVHAAVEEIDPDGLFDVVVNIQGDLPTLETPVARATLEPLRESAVDIATVASPLQPGEMEDRNVVKAVLAATPDGGIGRARTFTRDAAATDEPAYHHIGIYAFRRSALREFVTLPQSAGERRERLEQLRALENGMRIDVAVSSTALFDVNTPDDLARVRGLLAS